MKQEVSEDNADLIELASEKIEAVRDEISAGSWNGAGDTPVARVRSHRFALRNESLRRGREPNL